MANEPKKEKEHVDKRLSADEAEAQKKPEKTDKAAPAGGKIIFWAVLAAVVVLNAVMAVVLVQLTMPKPDKPATAAASTADSAGTKKEAVEEPAFSDPPIEVVVNIHGTEGRHFLKTVIVFLYDKKHYKDLGAVLKERTPEFKNIIVDELSSRSMEDLQRPNAREEIRTALKRLVNKQLDMAKNKKKRGKIVEVLINEFIIQ